MNGSPLGRLVFELYANQAPLTAENFRKLCTGEAKSKVTGKQLSYQGTTFHRVIPSLLLQGGDLQNNNGQGGESIYGQSFPVENYNVQHQGFGDLCMVNHGHNQNSSQFYVTFAGCDWLNGKNVVFGKLVQGQEVLSAIEHQGSANGNPQNQLVVQSCGELSQ